MSHLYSLINFKFLTIKGRKAGIQFDEIPQFNHALLDDIEEKAYVKAVDKETGKIMINVFPYDEL